MEHFKESSDDIIQHQRQGNDRKAAATTATATARTRETKQYNESQYKGYVQMCWYAIYNAYRLLMLLMEN